MNGRKRHVLVDTNGLLLKARVHAAYVQDKAGGQHLLRGLKTVLPRLQRILADGGYKPFFVNWVQTELVGRSKCLTASSTRTHRSSDA